MKVALLLALTVLPATALSGCTHDDNSWALRATGIAALRERGLTGHGVRIAVLDTGIDLEAPSLRHLDDGDAFNGEVVAYADYTGSQGGPQDHDGHGTFVAGVLAGARPSGLDRLLPGPVVPGGAPHVHLLVARVSTGEEGSMRALAHALDWALDNQADIVSLSIGISPAALAGQYDTAAALREQLARAEKDGVLVVAAAGNSGRLLFPADQPGVLAVGAVDRDLRPLYPGSTPDLYAPGRDVTGPDAQGGLMGMGGTSVAVPFVAAAAALVLSGSVDPYDARSVALLRGALVEASTGADGGPGLLQAERALQLYETRLAVLRGPQPL